MFSLGQWRPLEQGEAIPQGLPGLTDSWGRVSEIGLFGPVMCVGLSVSVSMSPSLSVFQSLSLAASLDLTHRAQRIVGFSHKVFIQPLEYNLGHSLKRGRAGPEGTELAADL